VKATDFASIRIDSSGVYCLVPREIIERLVAAASYEVESPPGAGPDIAKLGQAVKTARKEMGLNQSELADRAEISERTVRSIEKGEHKPQRETIEALVNSLGESFANKIRAIGYKTE